VLRIDSTTGDTDLQGGGEESTRERGTTVKMIGYKVERD
jgi:hypothetical protein